jgi:hypothetical protein
VHRSQPTEGTICGETEVCKHIHLKVICVLIINTFVICGGCIVYFIVICVCDKAYDNWLLIITTLMTAPIFRIRYFLWKFDFKIIWL